MGLELHYTVENNALYRTVDDVLIHHFKISNRLRSKLVKNNLVFLNGTSCDTRNPIQIKDTILVNLDWQEDTSHMVAKSMPLTILYEDDWLLAVNKPANLAIHPSLLHYENSLSNGIRFYFDTIGLSKKIRPVNRLDKNTTGIVIFAKCEYIQECLIQQMASHSFVKNYLCVTEGIWKLKKDTLSFPIARKSNSIIERCVDFTKGQPSITHYEVIKEFKQKSLVKCNLQTGRTHQIRVHMAYIGHPLVGDTLYGNPSALITRQALHCHEIKLIHPISQREIHLVCDLPDDMKTFLKNS